MTLPAEYQQLLARIGGDPFDQAGARDRYHRPIVGDRGYQRPSTMAKALDSEANLKDFFAREAVIGVARNPDWFLPRIRQLDENRGADGWKAAMRELVDELHPAADARGAFPGVRGADPRERGVRHALAAERGGLPVRV